ncbi:MAG TPA: hypothetical protein VGD91_29065, partial [Trebonia sp.]
MRLVTFNDGSARTRFGVLQGNSVVDPDLVLRADRALRSGGRAPDDDGSRGEPLVARDMVAFFETGAQGRALAQQALAVADDYQRRGDELTAGDGTRAVLPAAEVRLLAPVPRP